jgi:prepilin-type N-terminal cleavage/methylation domain-containing protein
MIGTKINKKGNTLPELIIALGILSLLFGIATISLMRSQRISAETASISTIIVDLRDQQTKAMAQDTVGVSATSDFGIYFGETSYIVFKGSLYNPSDTANFEVPLDQTLKFANVTLPNSIVVFKAGSGEVSGFTDGNNTFGVEDLTNSEIKTVTINKYGVPFQ